MPGVAFAEPERAEHNLRLIADRLPASLWASLPALLAPLPAPDDALNYLERFLRAEAPADLDRVLTYVARNPTALHHLLCIFGYSRFLSETLIQQPELVLWLHRPGHPHGMGGLERLKSVEDLHEEFARFEASGVGESRFAGTTTFDESPAVVLARFKRREYLRIVLRDALGIASLSETTLELSRLADVLLDRAHRLCNQKLQNAYGAPQYVDATGRVQTAQMTILSLGKLGAEELNYSSDVDLMFLYSRDGETAGGSSGTIANAEYFVRLAQAILKQVTEATPEGAVFRVDLRLRPQGSEGDLAVSLPAALDYYRNRAREWELQMLIKARPSAGDVSTGRLFLRELRPLIYRREFHLGAVEAVLNAREEITRELRRPRGTTPRPTEHAAAWNVKLSPGGIRDIEFLTQCLQRLYGGVDPWLVVPSTLVGLQRLHDKGFLSGGDFHRLAGAYEFLRKVEHRLQLRDGLQRHTLPQAADALDRLARRCAVEAPGGSGGRELLRRIGQHFSEVREVYDRILKSSSQPPQAPSDNRAAAETPPAEGALLRRLRSDYPDVARVAAEVTSHGDSYARRGLHRFLSSAVLDPDTMAALEAHPSWLTRAADLFSRSDLLVEMLARNPAEIAVLADPGLGGFRGPLAASPDPSGPSEESFEKGMAALRVAYRRGILATLVRGLASRGVGVAEPFATFEILTRLAEEALSGALHLAAREVLGDASLEAAPFAVIALGRLGTQEMDIGSDADLVFVLRDEVRPDEREQWRRLAERFVHVVSSHTREGLLFPADTRLRPRGTEGEIVQPVAALEEYFRADAQGWEAATYLKARPVAGNLELGARAVARVHEVLRRRFQDPSGARDLAQQLAHTRARLEKETAVARSKGEFKKFSGGYYDIDYLLALLALTCLKDGGPLSLPPAAVVRQIAVLQAAGCLEASEARHLRADATLYRAIDHGVRVVSGRPAHRLPDPAIAARITELFHQWGVPVEGTLEEAVNQARQRTRALYEQVILRFAESA